MTRGRAVAVAVAVAVALPLSSPSMAAPGGDGEASDRAARAGAADRATSPPEPVVVGALVETADGASVERYEVSSERAAQRLVEALNARSDVVAAEVSATMTHLEADELRGTQWGLDALQAEAAWEITSAEGTRIAVLDSGVDGGHPDLVNVLTAGFDLLDPLGDGRVDTSTAGHGTRVAGVAGAEVGNGIGMAGLAKDAEIVPVRVLDDKGDGDAARIAAGVLDAAEAGVDVINLSLGGTTRDGVLGEAIDRARRDGVIVVASSGNSGATGTNPPVYPAAEPGVIAVGAARDETGQRASFSSYGDWLDLVAPGERITTTCPMAIERHCHDGYHLYSSGTSFAAPFVSATAALVRAQYPRALPSQVAWRLTDSADALGQPAVEVGAGLVDPVGALTAHPDLGCRSSRPQTVDRTWDVGRVETAVAVSCSAWPQHETREVVLATARDFPDALAGAALASARGMPLLLTERRSIPPHLDEVLSQLGVARVHVLGGRAAIDGAVETALSERGIEVRRVSGADRYATAAAIATRAAPNGAREVLVVSGQGFADAVAAGAYQGPSPGTPLLLTRGDRLPAATADAIAALGPELVTVVGGPGAVADPVLEQIAELGPAVERIAGADRYATSAAVVDSLGAEGALLVASGHDYPDALAAGAMAGRVGGRLLLVPPERLASTHPAAQAVGAGPWDRIEIVGGRGAVSADVEASLADLLDD